MPSIIELYLALLSKVPKDYETPLDLVIGTRIKNEYMTYAIMKDRGSKADYIQTYRYDIIQLFDIVNSNVENNKWFVSIYLSWILHETSITLNNLNISFDVFCMFVENNLYRKIIETNRYECYGFCMSALTILDKDFLLKYNGDKKSVILKLAIEGIVTYIYNHAGMNKLWDAEIYSSYARLCDRFRCDMTMLLMTYIPYSYCYGMYEAFKCAPIECEYKLEYHMNALMMQQNQTVVAVTQDAMDASLLDAVYLGKQQFLSFTTKMLQYSIIDETDLCGIKDYIGELNLRYNAKIKKENGFENIRCIERYFQIEPYDKEGYKHPPYQRTTILCQKLLVHIGINRDECCEKELDNGEKLLSTPSISIYPQYHKEYNSYEINNSCIFFMKIKIRQDESISGIDVIGQELYTLYRDISSSGLFYDIPCIVGSWKPRFYGGMDCVHLLVGTDNDVKHNFNNL